MDGVPLIEVNDKEGLENIDDTIEIVEEDVDGIKNLSVHCRRSSIRSLLSLMAMAKRSPRPSIFNKTR
jgi:hypothetical protein